MFCYETISTYTILSLPAALLESLPVHPKMLHRLIYHALNSENDPAAARKIIQVEMVLPRSVKESDSPDEPAFRESFHPTCWVGQKVDLDIMMPDRRVNRTSAESYLTLFTDLQTFGFPSLIRTFWERINGLHHLQNMSPIFGHCVYSIQPFRWGFLKLRAAYCIKNETLRSLKHR
jgi:hypothetical protein